MAANVTKFVRGIVEMRVLIIGFWCLDCIFFVSLKIKKMINSINKSVG